jgi:hypothetical protein
MKKREFPKVVRVGHSKAVIYKNANRDSVVYTVAWYEGDVRMRKAFGDLAEAELHAQARLGQLSRGTAEILRLDGEELLAYVRAREAVAEFGLALDTVASEYRDAKRLVRGGSLVEAAGYYARQRLLDIPKKTVADVYDEMIKAKKAEGCSDRYIRDLESRVGKFVGTFGTKAVHGVIGTEIKDWLQGLDHSTSRTDPKALVEREVNIVSGVNLLVLDDSHGFLEMAEVVADRLVNQRRAVSEKENALLSAALPEAINDLEGGVGLARACGHDEQDTVQAAGDGLDGTIDGDLLVVTRRAIRGAGEVFLSDHGRDVIGDAFERFILLPEMVWRRESVERELGFDVPGFCGLVVEQEGVAVAAKDKRDVEGLGVRVTERLLDARVDGVVVVLGLDDREGNVRLVVEDVVCAFLFPTLVNFSPDVNAPIGEADFLANLGVDVPTRRHQAGRDELGADVALGEGFFVHDGGGVGAVLLFLAATQKPES